MKGLKSVVTALSDYTYELEILKWKPCWGTCNMSCFFGGFTLDLESEIPHMLHYDKNKCIKPHLSFFIVENGLMIAIDCPCSLIPNIFETRYEIYWMRSRSFPKRLIYCNNTAASLFIMSHAFLHLIKGECREYETFGVLAVWHTFD